MGKNDKTGTQPPRNLAARVYGPLYGFLFFTVRRRLLGVTLAGWLQFLALALPFAAWLGDRSIVWPALALGLLAGLRLLHWKARHDGYMRFKVQEADHELLGDGPTPVDDQKVSVRATGRFSVAEEEVYVLNRPALYWRAPIGDHALMVRRPDGRFAYQFVQAGTMESVRAGWLIHGRQPQPALAINFLNTWGPDFVDNTAAYYVPNELERPASQSLSVYLTFEDEADRQSVWRNLLRDVQHIGDDL